MSNGFHTPAVVSLFEKQSRLVFQRMARQVGKLLKSASADNVHKFRTHSRRVEALVSELAPQNGNQKKLLKLLSKLRKKAGRVRDRCANCISETAEGPRSPTSSCPV